MALRGPFQLALHACVLCWLGVSGLLQQQRFRVRPSNTSVVEGGSTVLRCEVSHQVGQLQWAKDGFAMGYARLLPGYPRYRLLGDAAEGVHDLEITNATIEDDGQFQCQVSPNKGQSAIRADAYLTVILKPQSIRLRAFVDDVPASEVVQVARGSTVTLTCDITGARPEAAIEWQRNGRHHEADSQPAITTAADDVRRQNSRASLTLRPTRDDDGVGYSCVARHPALRAAEQQRYNATVTFSVLYPPSAPVIQGYTSGEVLRNGEQRTLTCSSEGGNPRAQLVWTRNARPVVQTYRATRRGASASYTFIADQSDLHAVYQCRASSKVHPHPMVAQVETIVHFAPKRVAVAGTATARAGDAVHVTCVTSESNPPANITWVSGDRVLENVTWTVTAAADGGWISVSNITSVVPAGTDSDLKFTCYAQNPAVAQTRSGTAVVSILRAPQSPTILGYQPDEVLQAGERVTLSCLVRGGNPRPRLVWLSGGRRLEGRLQQVDRDTLSLLTLTVTAADNGRQLTCRSQNAATDGPHEVSTILRVSFPPSQLKIRVAPDRLQAGGEAELTCETQPSLPAAQITWWSQGHRVADLPQSSETFAAGDNGGYITRSVLTKPLNWTDNGVKIVCRADVQALTGTLQTARTLDVQHAPLFDPAELNITVVRGRSLTLNLTARANPAVHAYAWSRDALAGDVAVTSSTGVLSLPSVGRADAGRYRLRASNEIGSADARVDVDVLYPPAIVKTSSIILSSQGEDVSVACKAEANPLGAAMFTWSRPSRRLTNFTSKYANGTSVLKIPQISASEAGDYQCSVENSLGYDKARFTVVIKEAARIVKSARLAKAAAGRGEVAHVTCRARGAPAVTFTWSRDDDVIEEVPNGKYRIERKQIDTVSWASVLDISDVTPSDYGEYACRASNALGADSHVVRLVLPSVPDTPLQLRVLNVSSQAVTLAWTPAFDGGFIQGFRFRYFDSDASQPTVVDGDPNSSRFTVHGLRPDTKYGFTLAGYSQLGVGHYSEPPVVVRTSGTPPVGYVTDREDSAPLPYPRLLVGVASICGIVLLLLFNALLISCCHLRRRQKLRQHAGERAANQETAAAAGDEERSSISARSVRSNSLEDSIGKREDCQLLSSIDRGQLQSPFSPALTVYQPENNDAIEMTSQDLLLRRDSSTTADESYGYNHLRTSATFRDTLAGGQDAFSPSPDVIIRDPSAAESSRNWALPLQAASPTRRRKLVSFDESEAARSDSAQNQT